jgi:hypothetical protein
MKKLIISFYLQAHCNEQATSETIAGYLGIYEIFFGHRADPILKRKYNQAVSYMVKNMPYLQGVYNQLYESQFL